MNSKYKGLIVLLFFSVSAFANTAISENAAAVKDTADSTVAELGYSHGNMHPDAAGQWGVRITNGGQVYYFSVRHNVESLALLAVIPKPQMAKVKQNIAQFVSNPLVDKNPNEPGCNDFPVVYYSVTKASGQEIVFHKQKDCHEFTSEQKDSSTIQQTLDKVLSLAEIWKSE